MNRNSVRLLIALIVQGVCSGAVAGDDEAGWMSPGAVTGHYHERARLAPVEIALEVSGQLRLSILAPQARFDCRLMLDEVGKPSRVDLCGIKKLSVSGRIQQDVSWWLEQPVTLVCAQQGGEEICRGGYELYWQSTINARFGGSDHRVMTLVRAL
ncbi:hypothetical protein [Ferrimonas sp. SCSIO 43195]|uniref:hypothetical protein n=1 Tax=Ferrimonas sp. SCSIO 43195 TaxID=2822844 RepID=UPI002075C36D|nr:hypothetical protein [Ferrimonas sp. SCSIO 43195]USD35784.1 hypothetical protein J8Z22_12080 [Ferrimonas sp. SCSIO 43195]